MRGTPARGVPTGAEVVIDRCRTKSRNDGMDEEYCIHFGEVTIW